MSRSVTTPTTRLSPLPSVIGTMPQSSSRMTSRTDLKSSDGLHVVGSGVIRSLACIKDSFPVSRPFLAGSIPPDRLFLEQPVERGPRVIRCRGRRPRPGQVERLRGRVEGTDVPRLLRRDPLRDRLDALETRGRVEVGALRAGVQVRSTPRARRVETDVLQVPALLAARLTRKHDGFVDVHSPAPGSAFGAAGGVGTRPARAPLLGGRVHVPAVAILAIVHLGA